MGMMLHKTGAARWLAALLMSGGYKAPPLILTFGLILGVSLLKLILSSNSVTAALIVPLVIAFVLIRDLEITQYTLPAAFASSLAFILVTSGPTNVIPYASGYFSVSDMAKAGAVMMIVASFLLTGVMYGMSFLGVLLFRF
jgi:sodium-dependent dicarboxylate transporter 2/3/5